MRAAVALVLVPGMRGLDALLIRRAEHEGDPWSGHMALPGGRQEPVDVDLLETARRETLEEVAVEVGPQHLLGGLDDLHPSTRSLPSLVVRPFVFGMGERPEVRLSREVAQHLWVPLDELRTSLGTGEVRHRGSVLQVPAYRAGERLVWGLTQRILEPFLELTSDL